MSIIIVSLIRTVFLHPVVWAVRDGEAGGSCVCVGGGGWGLACYLQLTDSQNPLLLFPLFG